MAPPRLSGRLVGPLVRLLAGAAVVFSVAGSSALPAPVVIATSPADQTVGAPLGCDITITFQSSVDDLTVVPDNVLVTTDQRGKISGTLSYSAVLRRITFDPDTDFLPGERVMVTVTRGVEDLFGSPLAHGYHFQFAAWTAPMPNGGFTTSATSWPIGSIAFSVTVGDLDGDTLPEAVFANAVPDSLTVLTPDGAGAFSAYAQWPTHTLPRHSLVADVDEDGLADVINVSSGDTLDVFMNLGGGSFNPVFYAVPAGKTPYGGFVADLDADGDVDLATANFNGHDVSILASNGDGTFAPSVEYPAGMGADSPRFVDGADFDGDGDIDLACCNGYSYDVTVLTNDGNAVFTAQAPLIPVGESPNFLAARDWDGDGIVDLVTINAISEDLSFLKGNGDATFQPAVSSGIGGSFPYGLSSVDIDGDGDLDAVVPVRGLSGWRVMWNDGSGSFSRGALHLGGNHCHSIGTADWDGDGDVDVIAGYAISKDMYYYEHVVTPVVLSSQPPANATGVPVADPVKLFFATDLDPATVTSGSFQVVGAQSGPHPVTATWNGVQKSVTLAPATAFVPGEIVHVTADDGAIVSMDGLAHEGHVVSFMTEGAPAQAVFGTVPVELPGGDPVAVEAADLDGDLVSDLVVANYLTADVTLLLSGSGGLPAPAATVPVQVGPLDLWTADLDGNGQTDVVVANVVSTTLSLLMNSGGGVLAPQTPLSTVGAPFAVKGGDFDRDGDPDIAVAEVGPDAIRVFWNDGTGAFPTSDVLPVAGAPLDLTVADLDVDGDLDLVSVDAANSRMEVFHYAPGTGFSSAGTFGTGSVPVATFAWDTNGDGRVDLVSSDYAGGGISVLENLGDGASFAPAVFLPAGSQPHGLWGGDVTGDGQLELVTANSGETTVTLFGNQGGGVFDGGTEVAAGTTPYAVVGGDWNGDGRLDVAVVNRTSGTLTLLLNGIVTGVGPEPAAAAAPGLVAVSPNPFRERVTLLLRMDRPGAADVRVFDLRGRAVADVHRGLLPAGASRVMWDGRDGSGRRVAAGMYFVRLEARGRSWTTKVLHLR